jgi:UDP-N-acetylmuramate dehydrogenase
LPHVPDTAALRAAMPGRVVEGEPLAPHTTLRIGGPAALFAVPDDPAGVAAALRFASAAGLPWRVIGLGSNLLCPDGGFPGLVLDLGRACAAVRWGDGGRVEAGAGVHLARLLQESARRGLSGLEGVAGVPGTVGGALAMNAGTARGDFGAVVESVTAVRPDGTRLELPASAMAFRYRGSRLGDEGLVALSAVLRLRPADPTAVRASLRGLALRRRRTQPVHLPSAGSIWQNPPGTYAGRLIEEAGCKGLRRGGAEVSPLHANFIVNHGGATAADVLALMRDVRAAVEARHGVRLHPELRWLPGQEELEALLAG